jgi:hypothetical protein
MWKTPIQLAEQTPDRSPSGISQNSLHCCLNVGTSKRTNDTDMLAISCPRIAQRLLWGGEKPTEAMMEPFEPVEKVVDQSDLFRLIWQA